MTALHWATQECHLDITELLLKHNVNANIRGKNGKIPLNLTREGAAQETKNQKKFETITALLLSGICNQDI
jgi:hypothetical protein